MGNASGRRALSNKKESLAPDQVRGDERGVFGASIGAARAARPDGRPQVPVAKRRNSPEDEGAEAPSQTNYAARLIFSSFFSTIARFNRER